MLKCDDRFARQNRGGPPPEFPLASPSSSIVHHLSGPIGRAPTGTVRNRPPSVDDAPPSDRRFSSRSLSLSLSAQRGSTKVNETRTAGRSAAHRRRTVADSAPFRSERVRWDPKDGELCSKRVKPEETLVEARRGSDVQIDRRI